MKTRANKYTYYKVLQSNSGYGWDDEVLYDKSDKEQLKERDMKREERQVYYYTSRNTGERRKVYCTRLDYLFLKLYYDIDGLTPDEYEEYKAATR